MAVAGAMGISREIAEAALEIKPNPDSAINYIFEHGPELEKIVNDKKNAPKDVFPESCKFSYPYYFLILQ